MALPVEGSGMQGTTTPPVQGLGVQGTGVQGGGGSPPSSDYNILAENGDNLIAENGDFLVTEAA